MGFAWKWAKPKLFEKSWYSNFSWLCLVEFLDFCFLKKHLEMETSAIVAMSLLLVILWSLIGCFYFWCDCWLTSEFPCQRGSSRTSVAHLRASIAMRRPTFYTPRSSAPGRALVRGSHCSDRMGQNFAEHDSFGDYDEECLIENERGNSVGCTVPKLGFGEKRLYEEIWILW